MRTLILIPWPETNWSAAGRIAGRVPLPINETGRDQVVTWSHRLAARQVSVVYSSQEQASMETGDIIAARCLSRRKALPDLAEVDCGLWTGLTEEELRVRYPKVFKRWCEDPTSVNPPSGEGLADALERLRGPLSAIGRKRRIPVQAVVLGPLAFALARCLVESTPLQDVRSLMHSEPLGYDLSESAELGLVSGAAVK